jgi:hypothetical protein
MDYACICMVSVHVFERLQAAIWRCAGCTGMWHAYPTTCLPGRVSQAHVHQGCVGVSQVLGSRGCPYELKGIPGCHPVNRMGKAARASEAMATRCSPSTYSHSDSTRQGCCTLARMDSLSSIVRVRQGAQGIRWLDLLLVRILIALGVQDFVVFEITQLLFSGNLCHGGVVVEISLYRAPGKRGEECKSHSICAGSWQEADLDREPTI